MYKKVLLWDFDGTLGYRLGGMWSSALLDVPELQDILTHLGLSDLISEVINSALVGYEKPHPQIYRIALEKMGNPTEVWMIGDNIQADVLGAESAGIKGILVRKEDNRAVRQSNTLYEIPSIINTFE